MKVIEEKTNGVNRYLYDFREEVQRGAALLDEVAPGWDKAINLEQLDLSSGSSCMLGQVFNTRVLIPAIAQELAIDLDGDDATDQRDDGYEWLQGVLSKYVNKRRGEKKKLASELVMAQHGFFWPDDIAAQKQLWPSEIVKIKSEGTLGSYKAVKGQLSYWEAYQHLTDDWSQLILSRRSTEELKEFSDAIFDRLDAEVAGVVEKVDILADLPRQPAFA